MSTTQRLGIDIVGFDKTRHAFASIQHSLHAFQKTLSFVAGAGIGLAGGHVLKELVTSFIDINKHVKPVEESFTMMDRAWQQFALNVGKSGLNEALIKFNESTAAMVIGLGSVSQEIGSFLGNAVDALRVGLEDAGRAAAFLNDNIGSLGSLGARAGDALGTRGFASSLKEFFGLSDNSVVDGMKSLGLNTKALTMDFGSLKGELKALPPTFDEIANSGKSAEKAFEKLVAIKQRMFESTRTPMEKYLSGLRELDVVQGSLGMSADLYARQQAKLREEFIGTGKTVKDEFNAMEQSGKAFGNSLSSALSDIAGGTFKLKDALSSLLSDLTSLFSNRAFSLLGGGASGGFLGKLFGGASFGGLYAGGGTLGAGKWGIAGENGPEPIVGPATVIPNRGMGGNVVQIIDQRKNAPAIEQRQGSGGISQFIIRDAVNEIIGSGQADKALRNRHGVTPRQERR